MRLSFRQGSVEYSERGDLRHGSTLVVIIALMGMLSLLGVVFYTFAAQEEENAQNFLEAAKEPNEADLGPDVYFDWALRQAISGGASSERNSVLRSGRLSILANQFGNDAHPHSGRGIHLAASPTLAPFVDQDLDGAMDPVDADGFNPQRYMNLNDSPVANGRQEIPIHKYPQPDVDYSYPDINSSFIAYIGKALVKEIDQDGDGVVDTEDANANGRLDSGEDSNSNGFLDSEDLNGNGLIDPNPVSIRIIKPSYHRPEIFRAVTGASQPWYLDAAYKEKVLRAHPAHVQSSADSMQTPAVSRYLNADDATENSLLSSGGFWFRVDADRDRTLESGEIPAQGAWDLGATGGVIPFRATQYDFDEDNDLDGVYEGVLLDLDFPVQEDSSTGKLYIPMFSMTILDADGQFNLNAHGNLAANSHYQNGGNGFPFVGVKPVPFLSQSLHGVSSYEVNPMWGLSAQPSDVSASGLAIHSGYFGAAPANWIDLANMEFWLLNKGRAETTGAGLQPRIIPGRLGDADKIYSLWQAASGSSSPLISFNTLANSNAYPFPGIWDRDDNRDGNEGGRFYLQQGQAPTGANVALGQSVESRHPLSLGGLGRFWSFTSNAMSPAYPENYRRLDTIGIPNDPNPTRWIQYNNYQLAGDASWRIKSFADPNNALNVSYLMPNAIIGTQFAGGAYPPQGVGPAQTYLFDDMNEITLDRRFLKPPYDEVFGYEDMAGIFLSETDYSQAGISSRIRELAPANMNPGYNPKAADIRRRFTSESWDRKQFALAINSAKRPWEFNHDSDGDGRLEFPPAFGAIAAFSTVALIEDPFRPQLRRILAVENGNTNQFALQFRLGLNQLLDVQRTPQNAGNPVTSPLEYRPLTAHPTVTLTGPVPAGPLYVPPRNDTESEWWARRDRQMMARDIYVMLATFCRGDLDSLSTPMNQIPVNPTNSQAYQTQDQVALLREMAQFAVNLVDAVDRDNVATLFEYDENLSNGWSLDDNAYVVNASEQDRAVVVGVERQELAFSETLWAWQDKLAVDSSRTPFDEMLNDYHFLFMELRNLQPDSVSLGKSGVSVDRSTAAWRIRRTDTSIEDNSKIPQGPVQVAIGATENCLYFKAAAGAIGAGKQYTIATGDAYLGLGNPVDLYADIDATGTNFELIVPNASGTSTFTTSNPPSTGNPLVRRTNLDLVEDQSFQNHVLEVATAGTFLDRTTAPVGQTQVQLVLERRLNPEQPQLPLLENPWIVVDYMEATRQSLNVITADDYMAVRDSRLPNVKSQERSQALDAGTVAAYTTGALSAQMNSFNTVVGGVDLRPYNSNCSQGVGGVREFTLQQLHFDRDFPSSIDLFHVPLYSPKFVTRRTVLQNNVNQTDLARRRFLRTNTPSIDLGFGTPVSGNHWHRLLSFLEVPSKAHRQLGDAFVTNRTPGKINLNAVRYPEVIAGLLDVPEHIQAPDEVAGRYGLESNIPASLNNPIYKDVTATNFGKQSGRRDIWADFLLARDGFDPLTQLSLPGVVAPASTSSGFRTNGSRPFRDLSYDMSGLPNASVEQTVLRGQLADPARVAAAGLPVAEVDTLTERLFDLGGANDSYIRSRLMSKLMGNSTTRSNVFVVYMTVRFHEVYEDPNGNQRIGGRYDLNHNGLNDDDTHRGFFILDRSNAEEAFNVRTNTFDWKNVVKYRLTIN